jgi:drug/metabolite transporter (DMT)-like permease
MDPGGRHGRFGFWALAALEPLIVSVGAAIFLRESFGLRRWLGFALGLAGVGLMSEVWRPDFHWATLTANVLILLSLCSESAASIMGKPMLKRAGLLKILAVAIVAGAGMNLLLSGPSILRAAAALPLRDWCLLAYLGWVCTLAGYAIWFAVIRETPISAAALTVFIQPVAGAALAVGWLGESLRWDQFSGSLIILAGTAIGLSQPIPRSAPKGECGRMESTHEIDLP